MGVWTKLVISGVPIEIIEGIPMLSLLIQNNQNNRVRKPKTPNKTILQKTNSQLLVGRNSEGSFNIIS